MIDDQFCTKEGSPVPAVTADEMREVDRMAVEEFGIDILQMMENAGRSLAAEVIGAGKSSPVTVLAGAGGNGGGGLCCARHLLNHGFEVNVVLDHPRDELSTPAQRQLGILKSSGLKTVKWENREEKIGEATVVVDALIGYGLKDSPRGKTLDLINTCGEIDSEIVSLDVPSGLDSTTGNSPGARIDPDRTLTLALPKVGLAEANGEILLLDIGIPAEVFNKLNIPYKSPFEERYIIKLLQQ